MKRTEFEKRLKLLWGATSLAAARMLVRELRTHAARVDRPLREDFLRAVEESKFGLSCPTVGGVELRPGETWLLLYDASSCEGRAVRVCARFEVSSGDERLRSEVRRAHRGLLATTARACRELDPPTPPTIEPDTGYGNFEIGGGSLGLSVAIATLSAALRRPPAVNVAGSAQVSDDGRLRRVEHLAPKLKALHRSWPEVTRVVVATGQELPQGYCSPVEIVAVDTLDEAIPLFNLSLEALPSAPLDAYRVRVGGFHSENKRPHSAAEWARLSLVAWEASAALARDEREKSAEAALWAALFAVHAGDPGAADALLRDVPTKITQEFPELLVRKLITDSSNQIDKDNFQRAVTFAQDAVKLCEAKLSASNRRELFGQALGTQGRALMHLGAPAAAEPLLRQALDHHRSQVPSEAPRSACYLATCLRLAGRLEDALRIVDEALVAIDPYAKWVVAGTTRLFLRLERARIYAGLGRWEEATDDFNFVRAGQPTDASYPRLAAVRGLARTLRVLGRQDEADDALEVCLRIARQMSGHETTLERVAAMAAGESLVDRAPTRVPTAELEAVWRAAFPGEGTPARIEAAVRAWIY